MTKIFLTALTLMTLVCGISYAHTDTSFHPPQTEAEKALDHILTTNNKEGNILLRINKNNNNPLYSPNKEKKYSIFFTKALLDSVFEQESQLVKKDCGGRYNSSDCGFDFDVLSCTQDTQPPYVYITRQQTTDKAIITYTFPPLPKSQGNATYRLVKRMGTWKVDAISCEYNKEKFNIK